VLTASVGIVREPNARIVWIGELVEGEGGVEVGWRGEYVREGPGWDVGLVVELVDSGLGRPSSLEGWSVKWGAGPSSEDVMLVAELVVAEAGDEAWVALMDWVPSDVDLDIGCSCVYEDASLATVG
jgi:hypothetical protein